VKLCRRIEYFAAENKQPFKKVLIWTVIATVGTAVAAGAWILMKPSGPGDGFVSGNGRIEATEIDVATKLVGRVQEIMVFEGDFVKTGQLLAQMQIETLDAQRNEARAQSQQAVSAVASAKAQVAARKSDAAAARATVAQRESELDAAQRRFTRSEKLSKQASCPFRNSTTITRASKERQPQ